MTKPRVRFNVDVPGVVIPHLAGRWLTVEEVAAREFVTPGRVRQWIGDGKLPGALKLGRDWYVPREYSLTRRAVGRPRKEDD